EVLRELLELLTSLPATGKPSKQWLSRAAAVRGRLADHVAVAAELIDALLKASDGEQTHTYNGQTYTTTHFVDAANEGLAVAAVKFAACVGDHDLLPRLRSLAVKCVTVIGGQFGSPRSLKVANASAHAIADISAPGSITELLALERTVRHGTLLKQIRKAIDALADAQGVTRDDLLERAVEDHELEAGGRRDVALSVGTARVEVDARSVALTYVSENGTARKSFPAAVKNADGETIAALRAELKNIRKTIAGERQRLDGLMALDRRWPLADWQRLYLDHPITGQMARTLIWGFRGPRGDDVVAIAQDETQARTSSGDTVTIPADAEVRLWHPVHAAADDVRAWRQFLLDEQIAQPIKQAFRETYVLTPAEEQTARYSNRFAAHVFRQVQARALMKGRGWKPVALAWWDDGIDHGVARRVYEPFTIRAEFFYDPIIDFQPDGGDLYPYCASDQVRFFDAVADEQIDLADVPLLVFTEAMRDIDLFVGVTSIGADPQWLDRGEGRHFETYWNDFSFGELSEAAKMRHEIVEQLLPRLAIAARCELQERYLVVRGDLRTYSIHLGSANILMSPNDQYLCIVATRDGRADKLFLPFDDDPVLSLILSKALLLAHDTKITDETILAQIRGRG
ncbi:MAG TPA: DUF4132 domain-containing protein, partial [Solirubrobacteraceae bacterium]|nr:DUF4132 domain-containing protein [Solirubrobacteraceae bacterium]